MTRIRCGLRIMWTSVYVYRRWPAPVRAWRNAAHLQAWLRWLPPGAP